MQKEKFIYFNSFAAATATIGELTFTAVDKSAKGNLVSITIPESGTNSQVTVSVSGNAITCAIGTSDDMGGDDIVSAIEASAAASALVTVISSGTTHITSAVSETFLSGGEHARVFPLKSFSGMIPTSDTALTLFFKSMRNYDGFARGSNEVVISDSVTLTLASNNTHKELMQALTERFNSAQAGEGDIVLGDDRSDDTQYLSTLYTAIGSDTLASANS